jgi:crossover junction endodeoxyribonuclease RuvC
MAITGQGQASKEQVAGMLQRLLHLNEKEMPKYMDATDALGAAYCHFLQMSRPESTGKHYGSWKDFALKNKTRVSSLSSASPLNIED